jgi:hypothetical protein
MKLKTSQTNVIECGKHVENSSNICLIGTELACSYFPELQRQKNGPCSTNNSFSSVFGFNCKFYYKLEKYCSGKLIDIEIGIGYLIQENDLVLLKRDRPLLYKHEDGSICSITNPVYSFVCFKDTEYLILQSYHPNSLPELLVDPHSLIVSTTDNPVNIVNVDENALIGRLDGNVTSLSISDICNKATNLLIGYTKQIILSCSQLDVKKLKTKILQLTPSKPAQAKKGSIIYNEEHDTIQYFDGSRWRTLLWRFEDE